MLFALFLSVHFRLLGCSWWKCALLTPPDRNAPALQFRDDGAHGHGDRDGIEVGGMWRHSDDGNFRGRSSFPFHLDPVETSTKPHSSHDHSQTHVYKPGAKEYEMFGCCNISHFCVILTHHSHTHTHIHTFSTMTVAQWQTQNVPERLWRQRARPAAWRRTPAAAAQETLWPTSVLSDRQRREREGERQNIWESVCEKNKKKT